MTLSFLTALSNFGGGTGESLAYNPDDGLLYRFQAGTFESIGPNNGYAVTTIPTSGSNPYSSQAMTYVGGGQFRLASFANLYSLTTAGVASFIIGGLVLFNTPGTPQFQRVSVPLVIGMGFILGSLFFGILLIGLRSQHNPIQTGVESMLGKT